MFGSGWPEGLGGGGVFPLALAKTVQLFLGTFGGGEEEATGHFVELEVVSVFHQDDPRFSAMDTGDGAHLHAVGYGTWTLVPTRGSAAPSPPLGGGGVLEAGVAFVALGGGVS